MFNTQSLKTVIAIYMALLLLLVVILMDFVFVSIGQKDFIDYKTRDCRMLALALQEILDNGQGQPAPTISAEDAQHIRRMASINDIAAMTVTYPDGTIWELSIEDTDEDLRRILAKGAVQALLNEKGKEYLYDKIWGVFFISNHYLIVSSPLLINGQQRPAAVCTAVNLAPFYQQQRQNQMLIMFYSMINIIILVALGTYAISRSIIRPINGLVRRAEGHQSHDGFDFFYSRGRNEFRRLSNSLNKMVDRIEGDKRQLEKSLVSLEQANQEIKERQNELIRAEKLASVGRLSAGIAHEIGNPIGIVLGYLDILKNADITETEKTDYIARCQNEIQKINKIIRELLDFSRPSGKDAIEKVSVHALLQETLDLLAVQPVMRNITKNLELSAACDHVAAFPDKLRQVFVNLLLNAADAMSGNPVDRPGEITIQTSTAGNEAGQPDSLIITISDTGPGIREEDLEAIFDPFFTTKAPGYGTGLGLYVCYMIIDNIHGSISVDNRPGGGAVLTIRLPLSDHCRNQEMNPTP